jgi:hypothetical protein
MSEPYQSRAFTFVNKRANQLKDRCAKGLRHLKVAVVWGGQILLSPLQWLARVTQIFLPQLPPPPQRPILTSQPVSDINIEQALELVEGAGYPIEIVPDSAIAFDCYRSNTPDTSRQTVPANEWQSVRADLKLAQTGVLTVDRSVATPTLQYRANPRAAVATQQGNSHIAPPKKTIRGLCSLLSDRQLVLVTTENEILDILSLAQQQEIRRKIGLDIALAWHQWQALKLSDDSHDRQLGGSDRLLLTANSNFGVGAALDREQQLPSQTLFDRLTDWFQSKKPSQTSPFIQTEPPHSTTRKYPAQLSPVKYSFTPQPPKFDRAFDLPQLPPIKPEDLTSDRDRQFGEILTKFQPKWFKNIWSYYRDYVHIPTPTDNSIVYQPPQEFELIPLDPKPSQAIEERSDLDALFDALPRSQRSINSANNLAKKVKQNLEYQPDWIEAISEEIGYSQTPLARFLAWLDRIFLAIENWTIDLWHKIFNRRSAN